MKRSFQAMLPSLVVFLLATTVLVACGKTEGGDTTAMETGTAATNTAEATSIPTETPAPKEAPLEIDYYVFTTGDLVPAKDNAMHQWLLDNKNIDINYIGFLGATVANSVDRMNTMLAGGDIPDVVNAISSTTTTPIVNKWADAGYIVDMTPWIQKYPDLTRLGDPKYNQVMYANPKDGKMYVIPGSPNALEGVLTLNVGPFIREDWLEQVGMAAPTTPDELFNVLKAFKENIPDVNGKPIIPASFDNFRQILMYSWTKYYYNTTPDYKSLNFWFNDPHIVDYMLFMNKLYHAGLLDIETIVQQPDQYQAKLAEGRVGYTLRASSYMDRANAALKEIDSNARFIPSPPIQVPGLPAPVYQVASPNMYNTIAVSKKFAENERNIERFMEFLNWSISEEGTTILSTGPTDQYYVKNKDGLLEPKPEVQAQIDKGDKSFETQSGVGYYNMLQYPVIPRNRVVNRTDEVEMAQTVWKPALGQFDIPFSMAGTGPMYAKYWPSLTSEIAKWEAKAIFAPTEAEARSITQDMIADYEKIGAPEVAEELLQLIADFLKENPQ